MKFLLDENLTYKNDEYVCPPFFKSTDILGRGASDGVVFQYAKLHDMIVITKDKRFALDMIVQGRKTVFVDNYTSILVDPKIDVNQKYCSPITYYLQENDCIIVP